MRLHLLLTEFDYILNSLNYVVIHNQIICNSLWNIYLLLSADFFFLFENNDNIEKLSTDLEHIDTYVSNLDSISTDAIWHDVKIGKYK